MRGKFIGLAVLAGMALTSSAMADGTYTTGFGNAVVIGDGVGNGGAGVPATLGLVVPSDGINGDTIASISVGIAITHSWQGDLRVTLTAPGGGPTITLVNRPGTAAGTNGSFGFSADNFGVPGSTFMRFIDSGATVYDAPAVQVNSPIGDWRAGDSVSGALSLNTTYGGLNAVGSWTLTVTDLGGGDTGTIDGFNLTLDTVPAPGSMALLGLGGLAVARRRRRVLAATAGLALAATPAMAQFGTGPVEVEGNDTKATADTNQGTWTLPSALGTTAGVITGTSASGTGAGVDYFHLRSAAQGTLAIYRNRLSIGTGSAHSATLRGFSGQAGTTETSLQASSGSTFSPARFNQWYTFGRATDVYYRVAGSTTTAAYSIAYDLAVVTPKPAGTFAPGPMTFSTVGRTTLDTEMFLYDANFNQIGQNDDNVIPNAGLTSRIDIVLAAGTYYLAVGDFNSQSNAAHGVGPFANNGASGNRMEFADELSRTLATPRVVGGSSFNITVTDSGGSVNTDADAIGAYDMQWYVINVPAPSSVALLGLGGLVAIRRRRS